MSDMLAGIPRIESPLFQAEVLHYGLMPHEREIAQQLHGRGFATIDFPDPQIEERIDRIKANLGSGFGIAFDDPESDKTQGEGRIQDAWKFDPDVRAIAANEIILALLSRLYGRQAFPFQTLNFPIGTQQEVHSDSVHFSSLPERFMCGVWLAMEDITLDNGPLCYVPASHRWPIMTNALIGRRGHGSTLESAQDPYGSAWQALISANGIPEETFLARKGQALIWCANLLHGGSALKDRRLTRWSQVTHYFFEDCIYYTPAFSDESVGRLAMREVVSVVDGRPVPNKFLGETVEARSLGLSPVRSRPREFLRRLRGSRRNRPQHA